MNSGDNNEDSFSTLQTAIIEQLFQHNIKKFTGPVEHWLTTVYSNFWGLPARKQRQWEQISIGDVFLFHGSETEFLGITQHRLGVEKGVLGIGIVGAKSEKTEPVWLAELQNTGEWPYLIHFSELYWFGDVDDIRDAPVAEKKIDEQITETRKLAKNIISFSEMRERCDGYAIPAQGSPGNIKQKEKLVPVLRERLANASLRLNKEIDSVEDTSLYELDPEVLEQTVSTLQPLEADEIETDNELNSWSEEQITYTTNKTGQERSDRRHQNALATFAQQLENSGFSCLYTQHSDLIAINNDDVLLTEVKSITASNEKTQVRTAIGQLFEYYARDIENQDRFEAYRVHLCLLLNQEPSPKYRKILSKFPRLGVEVFWIDENEAIPIENSKRFFSQIMGLRE